MKQYLPFIIMAIFIVLVAGGWWYEHSLFNVSSGAVGVSEQEVSNIPDATAVSATISSATTDLNSLKKFGEIPLDTSGLPRNPTPLFNPSQ